MKECNQKYNGKTDYDTLKQMVTVFCSATRCRFRRDTGYYSSCHNPVILCQYTSLLDGRVYASGCDMECAGCKHNDCKLQEYIPNKEEGDYDHSDNHETHIYHISSH